MTPSNRWRARSIWQNGLPFLAAVSILSLMPFVLGRFGVAFLMEILIWGLLAMAFDFLYGYTGYLSLGHSIFVGVGVYGCTLSVLRWGAGVWLALLIALTASAVFAAVIGYFAVRVRGHGFIIVTVVAATVITLIALAWKSVTGGDDGLTYSRPTLNLGLAEFDLGQQVTRYYFVLFFVALSFFLCWKVLHSPLGRVLRLIRENEPRASFVGYNVNRYKLLSFVISGVLAGLSGALYSLHVGYASAEFFSWLISAEAVVWTLFGGAGTLYGAVLGTGVLLYLREYLSARWAFTYPIVLGAIIILVVTFAPLGLAGTAKRLIARFR